jgi:hypothetical protein
LTPSDRLQVDKIASSSKSQQIAAAVPYHDNLLQQWQAILALFQFCPDFFAVCGSYIACQQHHYAAEFTLH